MLRARLGEKCSCQDEADSKQSRCLKLMEPLGRIIRRIESGVMKALKYHIIPYHTVHTIPSNLTITNANEVDACILPPRKRDSSS